MTIGAGSELLAAVEKTAFLLPTRDLAEVMQVRTFEPLAMMDTSLSWPDQVDRLVTGELLLPDGMVVQLSTAAARGVASQAWASSGQVSTTEDLAAFYEAIFDELPPAASVDAMTTPLTGAPNIGLGIEERRWTEDRTGWGHASGGATGHVCASAVTTTAGALRCS